MQSTENAVIGRSVPQYTYHVSGVSVCLFFLVTDSVAEKNTNVVGPVQSLMTGRGYYVTDWEANEHIKETMSPDSLIKN